ncbi:hypothetical protein C8255_05980 [filamentous cyanobacterium CCP3]|nr:hypothetical protein C8255_05945 [filamentous cyanobacterium CCP3]PSR18721.1 hypothetical protein C8255_05980 [filamentous cyanobacterium CCP3]
MFKNPLANRGDFFRNVLTLMTGTTIAQVVPLLASPILRRIFSPEEFGVLALYISISSLAVIFGTGQYHIAVVLPKRQKDAVNIVALCILTGSIVSLLSLMALILYGLFPGNLEYQSTWIYFVPLKVLTASSILALDAWTIRKKRFSALAKARISQSFLMVIVNISGGLFGFGTYALLIGSAAGDIVHLGYLGILSWHKEKSYLMTVNWGSLKTQALEYRKFPLYSLPSSLISTAGSEMPIFLLNGFFGKTVLGYLSLTQRMIAVPTAIISTAILDVFKERASAEYRVLGNCKKTFQKTFKALLLISSLLVLSIVFLSPLLIRLVFGEEWANSAYYARALSPYFFFSFLVSPLTYVFFMAGKQKEVFLIHCYVFLSVPASLIIGNHLFREPEATLFVYSINYSVIYVFYLIRSFQLSRGSKFA